jgi:hypothetical protein
MAAWRLADAREPGGARADKKVARLAARRKGYERLRKSYLAGVGFGAGAVDSVGFCDFLVWCLVCFLVVVVEDEDEVAPVEDEDEDVEGAVVGFGAGADCCAATAIGRPNASARLASFFMTQISLFTMPICIV